MLNVSESESGYKSVYINFHKDQKIPFKLLYRALNDDKYVKKKKNLERSLIVENCPTFLGKPGLKLLFGRFGGIYDIKVFSHPSKSCPIEFKGNRSIVVFSSIDGYEEALNVENGQRIDIFNKGILSKCAFNDWKKHFDVCKVSNETDSIFDLVDQHDNEIEAVTMGSDDSWIDADNLPKVKKTIHGSSRKRKSGKNHFNDGFKYNFKDHKEIKNKLEEIRSNFERDKKKFATMRQNRKFKP